MPFDRNWRHCELNWSAGDRAAWRPSRSWRAESVDYAALTADAEADSLAVVRPTTIVFLQSEQIMYSVVAVVYVQLADRLSHLGHGYGNAVGRRREGMMNMPSSSGGATPFSHPAGNRIWRVEPAISSTGSRLISGDWKHDAAAGPPLQVAGWSSTP